MQMYRCSSSMSMLGGSIDFWQEFKVMDELNMRSPREKCIMQTRTNISFTFALKNSIVSTRFSQSGEQQEKTCLAEMLVFMLTLQCKTS